VIYKKNLVACAIVVTLLSGCGGGGEDSDGAAQPWLPETSIPDGGGTPGSTTSNTAPTVTLSSTTELHFGEEYTVNVVLNDPEGDPLTVVVSSAPDWLHWNEETKQLIGHPDLLGTSEVIVTVSDSEFTVISSSLALDVVRPELLNLNIPVSKQSPGDVFILSAHSVDSIENIVQLSTGTVSEMGTLSIPLPLNNEAWEGRDLVLSSERGAYANGYRWIGSYDALVASLDQRLTLPENALSSWSPTPHSTAYVHMMKKRGFDHDWSVFSKSVAGIFSNTIDAKALDEVASYYWLAWQYGDLFSLNSVLKTDFNRSEEYSAVDRLLEKGVTVERLKETSLVSHRLWSDLMIESVGEVKEAHPLQGALYQGQWMITEPNGIHVGANDGVAAQLSEDGTLRLGADVTGTWENIIDDGGNHQTNLSLEPSPDAPIVYEPHAWSLEKHHLLSMGLDEATADRWAAPTRDVTVEVEPLQWGNISKIALNYQSPYGHAVGEVISTRHIRYKGEVVQIEMKDAKVFHNIDTQSYYHWLFKERTFDFMIALPGSDGVEKMQWLDLYDSQVVKARRTTGEWETIPWQWLYNTELEELQLTRDDGLIVSLNVFHESALNFDHHGDINGRLYGARKTVRSPEGSVLSDEAALLSLHAKSKCEISDNYVDPYSESQCSPAKAMLAPSVVWVDNKLEAKEIVYSNQVVGFTFVEESIPDTELTATYYREIRTGYGSSCFMGLPCFVAGEKISFSFIGTNEWLIYNNVEGDLLRFWPINVNNGDLTLMEVTSDEDKVLRTYHAQSLEGWDSRWEHTLFNPNVIAACISTPIGEVLPIGCPPREEDTAP